LWALFIQEIVAADVRRLPFHPQDIEASSRRLLLSNLDRNASPEYDFATNHMFANPLPYKKLVLVISLLFLGLSTPLPCAQAQPKPPSGFALLFNGKDLSGWHGMPQLDPHKLWAMSDDERTKKISEWTDEFKKHWRVENGELVNDGKGPYATTDKEYGDIELLIEYKTVAKADSGIYLRATPQVQIWDTTKEGGKWGRGADKGSGGLFNNTKDAPGRDPLVLADKPFGEWNSFRITQVSNITTVYFNGKLTVDHAVMENFWDRSKSLFPKGPIQLQTHGGEIRWRNIFIREIPLPEAAQMLKHTKPAR